MIAEKEGRNRKCEDKMVHDVLLLTNEIDQ